MTTEGLTTKQATKIYDALHPTLGFLTRFEARLAEMGFAPTDEYFKRVAAARDAFHALTVATHYRSCESGVGPPPKVKRFA